METTPVQNPPATLASVARGALETLNAEYGVGNISAVQIALSGAGQFMQTPYQCRSRVRYFRIRHDARKLTVFALGHQRTVSFPLSR